MLERRQKKRNSDGNAASERKLQLKDEDKEKILTQLHELEPRTIPELENLTGISAGRLPSLVDELIKEGKVIKTKVKVKGKRSCVGYLKWSLAALAQL